MKKALLGLLLTVAASSAPGQGTITFGNQIPGVLEAPIYGLEFVPHGDYANAKTGNTAAGLPAGTQTYKGSPVAGWNVEFLAAWPGTDPTKATNFFFVGPIVMTGTGSNAGFFPTTTVTFSFLPSSGIAWVQVRVWRPADGNRTWYEALTDGGPFNGGCQRAVHGTNRGHGH